VSYKKFPKPRYAVKPRGWVTGYQRKGRYRVFVRGSIPRSVEFVDLVVPADQKGLTIPEGCEVVRRFKVPGVEERLIVKVPKERLREFDVPGIDDAFFEEKPKREPKVETEFDREIGVIREALKRLCPTLSVRRGTGTAYTWIDIRGSEEFGKFTEGERRALEGFGLAAGGNLALISPEDREYYVDKARKLLEAGQLRV
jgi:hypothetical protein